MIQFPKNFLWGAATSSYQVEGCNENADWWHWEKKAGKVNSAYACRHYENYLQDFDIAQSLHHNAHRMSIEWARVEPREGEFDQKEIQHYVDVILALRARHIEPMVTLHHFTNPLWFSQTGGWETKRSADRWFKYCEVMTRALAPHVRYWVTINEPTIYASHSYIFGHWPPQNKSYIKTFAVHDTLIWAHIKAYRLMHKLYKELQLPAPSIGVAQHIPALVACKPTLKNRLAVAFRNKFFHYAVLDQIARANAMDFIGLNYYSRQLVDIDNWSVGEFVWDVCKHNHTPCSQNAMGWDIYPEGLYQILMKLKKYNRPIMITENGICTDHDEQRWDFIASHLESVHRAIQEGANVQGYLYWSLMDNFEWDKGFTPRFGLLEIDYQTHQRTIRESAKKYAEVCRTSLLKLS